MRQVFFILFVALTTWSCKSDDEISDFEKTVNNLTTTTWTNPTVTNTPDGDLSDSYNTFSITFTKSAGNGFEGTYSIVNGNYAFAETIGHWKLSDDQTDLIFDSGKTMNMTVSETKLHLDFDVSPPDGGRTDGLSGHFVFEFSR